MHRKNYYTEYVKDKRAVIKSNKDSVTLLIATGHVEVKLENRVIKLTPNNIVMLKHGEVEIVNVLSKDSNISVLHIMPGLINDYLKMEMSDCPIFYDFLRLEPSKIEYLIFDLTLSEHMKRYVELLFLEASCPVDENYISKYEKSVRCALILLLTKLHLNYQETLLISESTMMDDYDIGKILKYMADHYATVSLSSAAEEFNFHPAYFSSRFKKMADCSFCEKLLQIRLEQAKRLLATTDESIQRIVETVGFTEKSYFYKVFKKNFAMTPLEYRKMNR